MLNQPTSSPMMTSMLGLPPRLAVVCRAGACVCPCATSTDVPVAMTDAAASVVPPRRTRRRSSAAPLSEFTWSFRMVLAPYSHHTPKAYMTRGCIDRLGVPSSRTVPAAVIWGAQVRAALQDFPRYFNLYRTRIAAFVLATTNRIMCDATCVMRIMLVLRRPPIGRPFPHVAYHVVEAVAVWRECFNRGSALVSRLREILVREDTFPGIRHVLAARGKLVTPRKLRAVQSTARGKLPFGFGRKLFTSPSSISFSIAVSHVHDRTIIHPADRGARPVRTPPIRTEFEFPPLTPVAQIDRVLRRSEDERACFEHLRQSAGIFLRLRFPFRESQVPGFVYKFTKLPVSDRSAIYPKSIDAHVVSRCLFRIMSIRAHPEFTAGHKHHVKEQSPLSRRVS